jgi:hypothetical protein
MRIGDIGETRLGTPSLEVLPAAEGGSIRGVIAQTGKKVRTKSISLTGEKVNDLIQIKGDEGITEDDLSELFVQSQELGQFTLAQGVVAVFDKGMKVIYIPGPFSGVVEDSIQEVYDPNKH